MHVKTKELTGPAFDWAVAKCIWPDDIGSTVPFHHDGSDYAPSRKWAHGGPIIEREKITLEWTGEDWMAYIRHDEEFFGPTPLIAAMRCYVASKLGDDIVIPEFLGGV